MADQNCDGMYLVFWCSIFIEYTIRFVCRINRERLHTGQIQEIFKTQVVTAKFSEGKVHLQTGK